MGATIKIEIIAVILIFLFNATSNTQEVILNWEKEYGTSYGSNFTGIAKADDNYVVSGTINYNENNYINENAWIIKIDLSGELIWQNNYGRSFGWGNYDIFSYWKGGYGTFGDYEDALKPQRLDGALLLNKLGEIISDVEFPGLGDGYIKKAKQSLDGGFIIIGNSDFDTGGEDPKYDRGVIQKISKDFISEWDARLGSIILNGIQYTDMYFSDVCEVPDGYLIIANAYLYLDDDNRELGDKKKILIKYNKKGDYLWSREQTDNGDYYLPGCIISTNDRGYIINGTNSSTKDKSLKKFDRYNNLQWTSFYVNGGCPIIQTANGNFLLYGNGWFAKFDENGALKWEIGNGLSGKLNYLLQITDQTFIAVGNKNGNGWIAEFKIKEYEGIQPPELLDPVNNKNGVGNRAWLSWKSVWNAISYDVQIDSDLEFSDPLINAEDIIETRYFVPNLINSHIYYWRVRSNVDPEVSHWSEPRSFTTMAEPPISINYPDQYVLYYLEEDDQHYIDRDYTIYDIPSDIEGFLWIKTAMDDKKNSSNSLISFTLDQPATIYIAYDGEATSPPDWITSEYSKTSYIIEDEGADGSHGMYSVWQKYYQSGVHSLGGNLASGASGAKSNYLTLIDILPFYSISGNVVYFAGNKTVPNVQVSLSPTSRIALTDQNGNYILDKLQVGIDYIVTPSKHRGEDQGDLTITSQDAYETAQISIGNKVPSKYQSVAADADGDGRILMWDASLIARCSAGIELPPGVKIGEWRFDPDRREYPNLNTSYENQNYVAVVIGDVDASWGRFNLSTNFLRKKVDFEIYMSEGEIEIPLNFRGINTLTSFDFTLKYDPQSIEFEDLSKTPQLEKLKILVNDKKGALRISGFAQIPISLSNDSNQLTLKFKSCENYHNRVIITVERSLINGKKWEGLANSSLFIYASGHPQEFKLYPTFPNPFSKSTNISFTIPRQQGIISLRIYDLRGRLVNLVIKRPLSSGKYQMQWDGTDLKGREVASGIYFLVLQVGQQKATRKIIKY